ncbi:hypothetical protein JL721_6829 [Aureococcus anophagefferens]|nr:hypothetical protein JL721_6829 [Aureococcus anophagefferens]
MKGLIEKIKAESAAVVNPCLRVKAMSFNHHQRLRLTLTDGDATIACNVAQKLNVTLRGLGIGGVVRLTNYLLNTIKGEQVVILLGAELVAPPRAAAPRRPPRAVAPPPRREVVATVAPPPPPSLPAIAEEPASRPEAPAAAEPETNEATMDAPPPGVFVTSGSRKLVCPSDAALKKATKLMSDSEPAKAAAPTKAAAPPAELDAPPAPPPGVFVTSGSRKLVCPSDAALKKATKLMSDSEQRTPPSGGGEAPAPPPGVRHVGLPEARVPVGRGAQEGDEADERLGAGERRAPAELGEAPAPPPGVFVTSGSRKRVSPSDAALEKATKLMSDSEPAKAAAPAAELDAPPAPPPGVFVTSGSRKLVCPSDAALKKATKLMSDSGPANAAEPAAELDAPPAPPPVFVRVGLAASCARRTPLKKATKLMSDSGPANAAAPPAEPEAPAPPPGVFVTSGSRKRVCPSDAAFEKATKLMKDAGATKASRPAGPRPIVVPRPVAAPAKPAAPAEVDDEPPAVTPGVFVTSGSRKLVCPSEAALKKASKLMNDARAAKPAAAKPKGPRPIRVPKRVGRRSPRPRRRRRRPPSGGPPSRRRWPRSRRPRRPPSRREPRSPRRWRRSVAVAPPPAAPPAPAPPPAAAAAARGAAPAGRGRAELRDRAAARAAAAARQRVELRGAPPPPPPRPRRGAAAAAALRGGHGERGAEAAHRENKAAALARKRSRQSPAASGAAARDAAPAAAAPRAPRPRLGLLRGEAVDRALALGRGDILEIHGKAGAGKSNLAHTLVALTLARTAPGAKVLVVETKGRSAARASLAFLKARGGNADRARDLLVSSAHDAEVLLATLARDAPKVCAAHGVSLLVVDCLADVVRALPPRERRAALADALAAVAALSKAHGVPAVLTNHVSADFSDGADPSAVVATDDATFAKVATARLRLTRSAASGERSATLVTGARDDFGDLPSSHFAVTAAGVADAGEPGDWMADVG